jgi:hypothetical protein
VANQTANALVAVVVGGSIILGFFLWLFRGKGPDRRADTDPPRE